MGADELLKSLQVQKESFHRIEDVIDGENVGIKKKCPFCGSNEVVAIVYKHDAGLRYSIFCCGCAAGIDPGWAQDVGYVVDMWNKRVVS